MDQDGRPRSPRRGAHLRGLLATMTVAAGFALGASTTSPARAQEPVPVSGAGEATPVEAPPDPASPPLDRLEQDRAQRRAYDVGVVMLGGIVICGVGLIALVLLWGSRTRRIARQPLPKVAPVDELWYLKGKKPEGPELADESSGDSAG